MFSDPRWGDDSRHRDGTMIATIATSDRDREDDAGPHLGRGPSSRGEKSEPDPRDRNDERWPELKQEREREHDARVYEAY